MTTTVQRATLRLSTVLGLGYCLLSTVLGLVLGLYSCPLQGQEPRPRVEDGRITYVADEVVIVKGSGNPIVYAIGVSLCGEPLGVYFIQSNGVPTWLPIELATATDTALFTRLHVAKQSDTLDICPDSR